MDQLLAKSPYRLPDGRVIEVPLIDHTHHVMDAAEALFGTGDQWTRLGESWLRFFRLSPAEDHWPDFHGNLLAACALHDWGKANDGFQRAIRGHGEQAIRHEHFSALLIGLPAVTTWLKKHEPKLDVEVVLSAVLTHHLKARGTEDWGYPLPSHTVIRLVGRNDQFQEMVRSVAGRLGMEPFDVQTIPECWIVGKPPVDVREYRRRLNDRPLRTLATAVRDNRQANRMRMLCAVRAGLITADAAGSGLVRTGESVSDWLAETFAEKNVWDATRVEREIIDNRVREVEQQKQQPFRWNEFQLACDGLPERALLLAPCGSGKTLAAWRWIAAQLRRRPAAHVLFLYPTRATAREGFKDYVSWAPEATAALMHGTSAFDLEGMFANSPAGDDRRGRDYEVDRRLFALAYWPRRVFSATVDQFLAFMQYGYSAVCMLPVLADAVVVIDEVHSFDRNMFSALKDFLIHFDVPVLCMTATLPTNRRDELIACGLKPPPEWPQDLVEVAAKPRYRLRQVGGRAQAEIHVREALKAGKRVLWVVNQVKRAHEIVTAFVQELPPPGATELFTVVENRHVPLICYHSRFRLTDRVARHTDTMRALKDDPGPALGVTTQVCEMSLDIDVDLLVTEECPVTSLVQRMGRCNRDRNARPLDQSGEVLVYPPDGGDHLPYSSNDLAGVAEFLPLAAAESSLSQMRLEELMLSVPCPQLPGDPLSRFLTSGPYAVGGDDEGESFREGNDFNRPSLLAADVQAFLEAGPKGRPGFVVPVPRKFSRERDDTRPDHSQLPGYLGVARNEHYHPAVGFCDFPIREWGRRGDA